MRAARPFGTSTVRSQAASPVRSQAVRSQLPALFPPGLRLITAWSLEPEGVQARAASPPGYHIVAGIYRARPGN